MQRQAGKNEEPFGRLKPGAWILIRRGKATYPVAVSRISWTNDYSLNKVVRTIVVDHPEKDASYMFRSNGECIHHRNTKIIRVLEPKEVPVEVTISGHIVYRTSNGFVLETANGNKVTINYDDLPKRKAKKTWRIAAAVPLATIATRDAIGGSCYAC